VERDDLYSAGVLGLLDAIEKFDPTRKVLFKTYAELRVRGAILDSLRDQDWVPRSVRRRAREVEAAYQEIERERGRPAADTEVAQRLGLSLPALQTVLDEVRSLTLTGLEQPDEDDEMRPWQYADTPANTPAAHFERAEIRELLTTHIGQLPERERQVIALYYVEELTMKEIGQVLGVTESRVSQLRTQAFLRLRGKLSQLKESLLPA
jgi:RNA polymerase sigma factor for flagellar operon FliA